MGTSPARWRPACGQRRSFRGPDVLDPSLPGPGVGVSPPRSGSKSFSFSLANGDWFYFAGIWRPATDLWPEAYAILTIDANPDIAPYRDRQMAVLTREQRVDWLDASFRRKRSCVRFPPAHSASNLCRIRLLSRNWRSKVRGVAAERSLRRPFPATTATRQAIGSLCSAGKSVRAACRPPLRDRRR